MSADRLSTQHTKRLTNKSNQAEGDAVECGGVQLSWTCRHYYLTG